MKLAGQSRARVVFGPPPPTAPTDRHWFVPEAPDGHYCAACGLPEQNRHRHAPREATA